MIPISFPSPRVSQLDAYILDNELTSLLKEQLSGIFQLHSTSRWSYNQNPELWSFLLNLIIFRQTVWKNGSSYGLKLQNLKLTDWKTGKIIGKSKKLLFLGLLLGTYFYDKIQSYLYALNDNDQNPDDTNVYQRVKTYIVKNRAVILSKFDHSLKVLNLINFTVFLVNGRYPSVMHRVLGISLTPIVTDLLRFNGNSVNFEFQNRQLVWNVMTEFLVFTLPLLQIGKLRRMAKKALLYRLRSEAYNKVASQGPILTQYTSLPISQCAVCHDTNAKAASTGGKTFLSAGPVTNPYVTNCGHIYCYVCIATRFNAIKLTGEDLPCLRCEQKLLWFKEYGVDDNEATDPDAIIFEAEENDEDDEDEVVPKDHSENYELQGVINSLLFNSGDIPEDEESESESDYSEENDYEEDEGLDL